MSKTKSKPKHPAKKKAGGDCPSATCSQLDELCAWLADQAGTAQCERIAAGNKWVRRARASGQCSAYFHALAKVREMFGGIKRPVP